MFSSMIRQEFIGISRLSIPLILLCVFSPQFVFSYLLMMLYSLAVGLYLGFVFYKDTIGMNNNLKYEPTGKHKQLLQDEVIRCGLEPKKVNLRYAYVDDALALTIFNTIVIDPMLWDDFADDPECVNAKKVVETYVTPDLSANKKTFHTNIKRNFTSEVQKFIFRHELAHVVSDYSNKRILLNGMIGFLFSCVGFLSAYLVVSVLGGPLAFCVGFLTAFVTDLLLSWTTNQFFKAREEKQADLFAVQFSSSKEIKSAADFFKQYELHAQKYREITWGVSQLPVFLTGYVDGINRAKYLNDFVSS